jgi:hypothetical protein
VGLACVLALAAAGAADVAAHPPAPVTNGGRPVTGSIHRWLHQAKVPLVRGRVKLVFAGCPRRPWFVACVFSGRPRRIYLRRRLRHPRAILYHELGHVFDLTVLNRRERRAFKRVMHFSSRRRWFGGVRPPSEWFADGYALCARRRSIGRRIRRSAYGYSPTRRQHASVCRLIRRAAAPRGAKPQRPRKPPRVVEPRKPPPPPPPSERPPPQPEPECSWLEGLIGGCD